MKKIEPWMSPEYVEFMRKADDIAPHVASTVAQPWVGELNSVISLSKGESSAVYKIEGNSGSCVLKFVHHPNIVASESEAITRWSAAGVSLPSILDKSVDSDLPYLLLEYIAYPILEDTGLDQVQFLAALEQLGNQMRMMHQVKISGFGILDFTGSEVRGELTGFEAYFDHWVQPRILRLQSMDIWSDELQAITERSLLFLTENTPDMPTVLIHDDLLPYNCFYNREEKKLIAFDPNTHVCYPTWDVGRTFFRLAVEDNDEAAQAFLRGYGEFDEVSLRAAVALRGIMQLSRWVLKGKLELVDSSIQVILNPQFK